MDVVTSGRGLLRFGALLAVAVMALVAAAPAAASGPSFVRAWGGTSGDICTSACQAGTADNTAGAMNFPYGVAVSGTGDVYVADTFNYRIDEYTQAGDFVRAFGSHVNSTDNSDVCTAASQCQAGTSGSDAGQLSLPQSIAVSGSGDVYVGDSSRIDVYSASGTFLRAFGKGVNVNDGSDTCDDASGCQAGTYGDGAGEIEQPDGVAVSGTQVYVADKYDNRIDEFGTDGTFVQAFGDGVNATDGSDVCAALSGCVAGTAGTADGQLDQPEGVGVSGSGDIYVIERGNARADEFTPSGTFVRKFGTSGSGAGELDTPLGIAVSGAGDVYVGDFGNNRVSEFTQTGSFVRAFGRGVGGSGTDVCTATCQAGAANGQAGAARQPIGLAVSGSGDLYVAENSNNRVSEFTASGGFVRAFGKLVSAATFNCTTAGSCPLGDAGTGAGQLSYPAGVATSGGSDVYVADRHNDRIGEFTQDGSFVRAFGKGVNVTDNSDVCTASSGCQAGSIGGDPGELNDPVGVAVSGPGNVYVADRINRRVDEFTGSGTFVRAFGKDVGGAGANVCTTTCFPGTAGSGAGQLQDPYAVAVDGAGDVYVSDSTNQRIVEYTQSGTFVRAFGKDVGGAGVDVCTATCQAGSAGGAAGEFDFPTGVAVAGSGHVFVADQSNQRIDEFTATGTFVRAFGKGVGGSGINVCTSTCQPGSAGGASGQLGYPLGVAVSGAGHLFVSDLDNNRIDEFTQSGSFLRAFGKDVGGSGVDVCRTNCQQGTADPGPGGVTAPYGVAVSGAGNIYDSEPGNARIEEFSPATNDPPVAAGDSYSTAENTALTVGSPAQGVLANDTDPDQDPLSAVGYTDPAHGTLSHNADGTFTYTPAAGFNGTDSFTYRANDGTVDSAAPATVSITVTPAGTPPLPPPGPTPRPVPTKTRVAISHRRVPLVGKLLKVRMLCRGTAGARCTGTIGLDLTSATSRLKAAAAPGHDGRARFSVATSKDGTVHIKASRRLLRALRKRGRVIVMATATSTGTSATKLTTRRKLTIITRRSRGR